MTEINYLTQTQLAERWQVAEGTLERWRSEGNGPIYMKMMGRVRYRLTASLASSATSLSPASKRRLRSMRNPRPTSARITTSSGLGSWSWTWCHIRVSPAPRSSIWTTG